MFVKLILTNPKIKSKTFFYQNKMIVNSLWSRWRARHFIDSWHCIDKRSDFRWIWGRNSLQICILLLKINMTRTRYQIFSFWSIYYVHPTFCGVILGFRTSLVDRSFGAWSTFHELMGWKQRWCPSPGNENCSK